jgi:hypothetical protein
MEMDELNHESIVGAGDASPLLDVLFCFPVIVAKFEDQI